VTLRERLKEKNI
jgi:hypothetical protein